MESVSAAAEKDHRGRQGLVANAAISRGSSRGCPSSAGVDHTVRGGSGGDSGVGPDLDFLPSSAPPGIVGDVLGVVFL